MNIKINNETKTVEATNLTQLATELAMPERGVAIAVNNRVVPRTSWADTALNEGDNVTIIKAAFGG